MNPVQQMNQQQTEASSESEASAAVAADFERQQRFRHTLAVFELYCDAEIATEKRVAADEARKRQESSEAGFRVLRTFADNERRIRQQGAEKKRAKKSAAKHVQSQRLDNQAAALKKAADDAYLESRQTPKTGPGWD
ncbi:hypothetical protein [Paraburkholderia kururiensis]|uniref:Uncharacterized protein n=1 Tax=Paraburkholderia kururiensis TaxID=984307 RepID=A0ABZ0WVH5_9BURK|nr:hypothetical protein [Paraburkholderia kururiensis]WQD81261.1 hypothetical protein U0042_29930 [Paraburkholderia kururiensis]